METSQASDFGPPSSSKSTEADFLPPLDLTKRSFIHFAVAHVAYQVIRSAGQLESVDLANTDQTVHCEKNLEEEEEVWRLTKSFFLRYSGLLLLGHRRRMPFCRKVCAANFWKMKR